MSVVLRVVKDPPPLPVVVANLIEVARRWKEAEAAETAETATRQGIVEKHLAALKSMSTRSHATQTGVQHSLCTIKFLVPRHVGFLQLQSRAPVKPQVLHDGSLVSPCETFDALHDGRAESSDEDVRHHDGQATFASQASPSCRAIQDTDGLASKAAKSSKKARWGLPQYLRPYRRLLLGTLGQLVCEFCFELKFHPRVQELNKGEGHLTSLSQFAALVGPRHCRACCAVCPAASNNLCAASSQQPCA